MLTMQANRDIFFAKSLTLQYLVSSYFPCWPLEGKLQKLIIILKHCPCFPLAGQTDYSTPQTCAIGRVNVPGQAAHIFR